MVAATAAAVLCAATAATAAPSPRDPALQKRCVLALWHGYRSPPPKALKMSAMVPPREFALLATRTCFLGVAQGLVLPSGEFLNREAAYRVTTEAIQWIGYEHFHTLVNNDLAVHTYRLKKTVSAVTVWDRCASTLYSVYDATPPGQGMPERPFWVRVAGLACTIGLQRGQVPPSGYVSGDTAAALVREAAAKLRR
jgi:hypothetical protein